jgi:hypothetical protein
LSEDQIKLPDITYKKPDAVLETKKNYWYDNIERKNKTREKSVLKTAFEKEFSNKKTQNIQKLNNIYGELFDKNLLSDGLSDQYGETLGQKTLSLDFLALNLPDFSQYSFAYDLPNVSSEYCSLQLQDINKKIDDKIASILYENGLDITDKKIEFSIDQDGKITVSRKRITLDQKESLDRLFNEDYELRADLLDSHSLLIGSSAYLEDDPNIQYNNLQLASKNALLLREYGITINDFEITSEAERAAGALPLKFKNKSDDELLNKLFKEDAGAFDSILRELQKQNEIGNLNFKYNFSYKNGVTIENGKGDKEGLEKRYADIFGNSPNNLTRDSINATITINPDGKIIDAKTDAKTNSNKSIDDDLKLFALKLNDNLANAATKLNELLFDATVKSSDSLSNSAAAIDETISTFKITQTTLRQYVYESQRLFRFQTGVNEAITKEMNVTTVRALSVDSIKNYIK